MMSDKTLYLGIDGGGSKTAVTIVDREGLELGRGWGGSCNITTQPDGVLRESIREAVGSACTMMGTDPATVKFAAVCAGIAGWSAAARRFRFDTLLKQEVDANEYRLEPDYVTAWWGATHGEAGVVVIAGTGAAAYGRNSAGAACLVDGLGHLLGDRGGGFWIGLEALRHTVTCLEQGTGDPLATAIQKQTGTDTRDGLVEWVYTQFQPARIAALAPIIGQLADAGEPPAVGLVTAAAGELRLTAQRALQTLDLPKQTPIYLLGGAWKLSSLLSSLFAEASEPPIVGRRKEAGALFTVRLMVSSPRSDASAGAALMARISTLPPILGDR